MTDQEYVGLKRSSCTFRICTEPRWKKRVSIKAGENVMRGRSPNVPNIFQHERRTWALVSAQMVFKCDHCYQNWWTGFAMNGPT